MEQHIGIFFVALGLLVAVIGFDGLASWGSSNSHDTFISSMLAILVGLIMAMFGFYLS